MASVHGSLAAGELTALAGAATPRWFLSVCNNSETATAQINMPSGITFPVATLTVDNTSGAWASVATGNTVAIGSAPGLADYGLYRVRKTGNATTLHVGEASSGDPGLVTLSIRNATFGDNAYITVFLRRRDIWSIAPRIIATSGTLYENYDETVGSSNTTPDCVINITFTDTDRRAGFVDPGQTYRTVRFDAAEDLWPTSASIASRLWTAPAAWGAPTAGATNTASVTYRVPRSAENYEIQYQATDNNGIVTTAYRQVWACDRTGSTAPFAISEISNISWGESGMQLTVVLNGQTLASVPTGAMIICWYEPTTCFNGGDITSAISQFVGWVVRQNETSEPGLTSVTLEIAGPEGMLSRRGAYSQWFDKAASPTTWQQLPSTLEFVDFLTWWCAWKRARGVVECFNYVKDGHSNLTARLPQWRVESAGNLLSQMRKIAEGYRHASVGCNPDGTICVKPKVNHIDYSQRSALGTRCTLNETRYHDVELVKDPVPRVRHTRGEGFYWDGAATQPTAMLSDAPGDAPGQGTGDETLQSQTVDNQAFLNTVTGLAHADSNNPYGDGSIHIAGFWPVFYPAERQYVALSIPASLRPDGIALAMNVLVKSVTLREVEPGAWDTILSVEGETSGVAGVTVPVPTQVSANPPYVPPIVAAPLPAGSVAATHGGGSVIVLERSKVTISTEWGPGGSPHYTNITGTGLGGTFTALALDPFSDWLGAPQSGNLGAWVLSTTGLYYTPNILSVTPLWTLKNNLLGYAPGVSDGILRPSTTTPGVIYVAWVNDAGAFTSLVYTAKLTAYGATLGWTNTLGDAHNGAAGLGMDIDHYGSDEMLVSARDLGGPNGASVYRILNGSVTRLTGTFITNGGVGSAISFIQKPLYTFGAASNSGTGGTEAFIFGGWTGGLGQPAVLYKTADGGASNTDITPAGFSGRFPSPVSSIAPTDGPTNLAVISTSGGLWTSTNAGSSWTSRGGSPDNCLGFFPRLISSQYALFMASTTNLYYSPDFGATQYVETGSYTTDIGAISEFRAAIPLY